MFDGAFCLSAGSAAIDGTRCVCLSTAENSNLAACKRILSQSNYLTNYLCSAGIVARLYTQDFAS